jgi:SAM-dependent methyltransferase
MKESFQSQIEIKELVCSKYNYSSNEYDINIKLVGKQYPKVKEWIETGRNNFNLYQDKEYIFEVIESFKYTKESIRRTKNLIDSNEITINSILDYGCGLGLSTLYFSFLFPTAKVYAYDLSKNNLEFLSLIKEKYRFENVSILNSEDALPKADLCAFFEVIEHNENIDSFFNFMLKAANKYFVYTSKCDSEYLGHFETYIINNNQVKVTKLKRELNKLIKEKYALIDYGWNRWPALFLRK